MLKRGTVLIKISPSQGKKMGMKMLHAVEDIIQKQFNTATPVTP